MRRVQLVVCGSVAVNRTGARRGKDAGDSDIEIAPLTGAGLIGPGTVIATTVPTRCRPSKARCRRRA
jgi:5-formyltetrahydrofolate cyclo-ligase